jgi:DNA-nicking Smr family endonuclease
MSPVEIEITSELDLHTFQPREIGSLLEEYLDECRKRGLLSVRVIHGKGTGALRRGVHEKLAQLDGIESITWPASASTGGWGATWVRLKPISKTAEVTSLNSN